MNVQNAFLHGDLIKEFYMHPPSDLDDKGITTKKYGFSDEKNSSQIYNKISDKNEIVSNQ